MVEWRDNMIRRLLIQFVVFCCVMTGVASVAQAKIFTDIPESAPILKEFTVLIERDVITQNPEAPFRLNDSLTRFEAAEFIIRALKVESNLSEIPTYQDIEEKDPRMPIITAITQLGLMTGDAGYFNPDVKLTRAQAADLLAKAFQLTGEAPKALVDVPASHPSAPAINALVANQIVEIPNSNKFRPNVNMTRAQFAEFVARIIEPSLREKEQETVVPEEPQSPQQPEEFESCERETNKTTYLVDVAVANMWNKANQSRIVDLPSTKNQVEMQKWISSLSIQQKKWLVGRTDTQALYGDEVTALETKGNWMRVAAKDQYVPYLKSGYPGWVSKRHITSTTKNYDDCAIAIVTAKKAMLFNEDQKTKFMEISYATILPVIKEDSKFYHVQTPSKGVKLLKKADSKSFKNYSDVPKPTATTVINEAKRYLNLPYLWAGTSSWGYDCSGILYAIFRTHGIMIPRDSFYQAQGGKAVAKKDLKPGDLVFFAYNGGKGKVYHVGLYIGDGKMLHAPHYASKVKIESMNQGTYKKNYSGARRYL